MSNHVEFPELTPGTKAACDAAFFALKPGYYTYADRRSLAAFLREAMKQAWNNDWEECWDELKAIADNLHSPQPPPPTLAEARAADLDTPEGRDAVRAFLATLREGGQP